MCLCTQTQSMGSKTIGIGEDVYDRLRARKREGESFTDLVNRLLEEATADWREGFGTLPRDEAEDLERAAEASREDLDTGLSRRQEEALDELAKASHRGQGR